MLHCLSKRCMKTITKILIAVGILLLIAPSCSAFTVISETIDPDTPDFTTGDPVTVDLLMGFNTAFPGTDYLKFRTELSSAQWSYDLIIGGVSSPAPTQSTGSVLYINGFNLEYPSSVPVEVRVVLEGVAPETTTMTDKTILEISQINAYGKAKTGSDYTYSIVRTVVNPEEISARLATQKAALASLRSDIDANATLDVDTAPAEGKYNEAKTALDSAETPGCTSPMTYINTASAAIEESRELLNQAWAEKGTTDTPAATATSTPAATLTSTATSTPSNQELLDKLNEIEAKMDSQTGILEQIIEFFKGLFEIVKDNGILEI